MSLRHEMLLLKQTLSIIAEALEAERQIDASTNKIEREDTAQPQSEQGPSSGNLAASSIGVAGVSGRAEEAAGAAAASSSIDSPSNADEKSSPADGPDSIGGDYSAMDWLGNIPWDSGDKESMLAPDPARVELQAESDKNSSLSANSQSADDFFSAIAWDDATQDATAERPRDHQIASEKKDARMGQDEDAESFFGDLDWTGEANPGSPEVSEQDPVRVTIDPGQSEAPPEHVKKLIKGRGDQEMPDPSQDAVDRSENASGPDGEGKP